MHSTWPYRSLLLTQTANEDLGEECKIGKCNESGVKARGGSVVQHGVNRVFQSMREQGHVPSDQWLEEERSLGRM